MYVEFNVVSSNMTNGKNHYVNVVAVDPNKGILLVRPPGGEGYTLPRSLVKIDDDLCDVARRVATELGITHPDEVCLARMGASSMFGVLNRQIDHVVLVRGEHADITSIGHYGGYRFVLDAEEVIRLGVGARTILELLHSLVLPSLVLPPPWSPDRIADALFLVRRMGEVG